MNNRKMRDYIYELLELSLLLQKVSTDFNTPYEKAVELRKEHEKAYKKWLFYKNLQQEMAKQKSK